MVSTVEFGVSILWYMKLSGYSVECRLSSLSDSSEKGMLSSTNDYSDECRVSSPSLLEVVASGQTC